MAIPSKATVFKQQMDPADRVEWQIDADAVLLEAGETIDTYTLVLDSAEEPALTTCASIENV